MNHPAGAFRPVVLGRDGEEAWAPLSPETLAAAHPWWARDVARLGPWRPALDGGEPSEWRAAEGSAPAPVFVCGRTASSFEVARLLHRRGRLPEWGAALAVEQTGGRGQRGRSWLSPPGNLYAAWRWPRLSPPWRALTPLAVGLLLARALEVAGLRPTIKWPNDVLLDGRKVAGILVEDPLDACWVGMGVNLAWAPPDAALRGDRAVSAGCLADFGLDWTPLQLWERLVAQAAAPREWERPQGSPARLIEDIDRRLAWRGQRVQVGAAGEAHAARLLGLAPDGALRVERAGRELVLYSANLSPEADGGDGGDADSRFQP